MCTAKVETSEEDRELARSASLAGGTLTAAEAAHLRVYDRVASSVARAATGERFLFECKGREGYWCPKCHSVFVRRTP